MEPGREPGDDAEGDVDLGERAHPRADRDGGERRPRLRWRPSTTTTSGARSRRSAPGDTDGNEKTAPDPGWTPFIGTPCFPSYPSAHASASYAARKIVEEILGGGNHWITLSHPNTPVTLSYTKFSEITDDIDDARVFGGIHFRFDQAAGAVQGRAVGFYVCQNTLRPISGDSGTCRE